MTFVEIFRPAPIANEIQIQAMKERHVNTVNRYVNHHCDVKGVMKGSQNLSESELNGMKQIREEIETKGWHLYQTDKSGRMCLDTIQNYVNCMSGHTVKDEIVTAKRIREAEQILNNCFRTWIRMCQIGEGNGHEWRVNSALISNFATIPPLLGLRKDQ